MMVSPRATLLLALALPLLGVLPRAALADATAEAAVVENREAPEVQVLRVSHQLPPGHHVAHILEGWAKAVARAAEGRIEIRLHGANSAFQPEQNYPAVVRGEIEAALSSNFQWSATVPEMNLTLAPFALADPEALERWPDSAAAAHLEGILLEKGVRNLAWLFVSSMTAITSKGHALVAKDDFAELRLRSLGPLLDETFAALGAAPTETEGNDTVAALREGTLEAGVTDVAAAHARRYYEVQDHVTVTPLFGVYFNLYVNAAFWDGLGEELQEVVLAASAEAEAEARRLLSEAEAEAPEHLEARGMKVHVHSAEETAALAETMAPAFARAFEAAVGESAAVLLMLIADL